MVELPLRRTGHGSICPQNEDWKERRLRRSPGVALSWIAPVRANEGVKILRVRKLLEVWWGEGRRSYRRVDTQEK
jgi:hypothetical protein